MLAVPLQGYAAASMIFCGTGSSGAVAAASVEPSDSHDHAQHRHGSAQPPETDSAGAASTAEPEALHKCGTCGACHAAALVGTLQPGVFNHLPQAQLAEPFDAMATVPPRVLDKPPRA